MFPRHPFLLELFNFDLLVVEEEARLGICLICLKTYLTPSTSTSPELQQHKNGSVGTGNICTATE